MVRHRYEMLFFGNYYHENLIIEGLFINIDINGKGFFGAQKYDIKVITREPVPSYFYL